MLETNLINYGINGDFEGVLIQPKNTSGKLPAVLIFHDWSGCNEFAKHKAKVIAELGYIGFAVDMYGQGKVSDKAEDKKSWMQPLMADRALLKKRAIAALEALRKHPGVDTARIAAIGFCFGGLCALDLARTGVDIRGVVSFHGLLLPSDLDQNTIKAKILVLHGSDDPMVPMDTVIQFQNEMKESIADWQVHIYGNTKHAFMNPEANDNALGTVYNSIAEKRGWMAMKNFLAEIFN